MRSIQVKDDNGYWVDGEPVEGEYFRRPIAESGWHTQRYFKEIEEES